jgi:hypothetical protein
LRLLDSLALEVLGAPSSIASVRVCPELVAEFTARETGWKIKSAAGSANSMSASKSVTSHVSVLSHELHRSLGIITGIRE